MFHSFKIFQDLLTYFCVLCIFDKIIWLHNLLNKTKRIFTRAFASVFVIFLLKGVIKKLKPEIVPNNR